MANIPDDNLIPDAKTAYLFSRNYSNADFVLQSALSAAINTACATGAFTASYNAAATAQALVEAIIQRLKNAGFGATISGTTITVTWSNVL